MRPILSNLDIMEQLGQMYINMAVSDDMGQCIEHSTYTDNNDKEHKASTLWHIGRALRQAIRTYVAEQYEGGETITDCEIEGIWDDWSDNCYERVAESVKEYMSRANV